jgi:hypothetical protein
MLGALLFGALLVVGGARASVSIAVSWDSLLRESTAAAVVTPVESRSVWENGRIYTYTRVRVDRGVAGTLAGGGEAWVRTMGGVVGKIGQLVDGEAVLAPGHSALLFLHPGPVGAFEVTARGQGQFPVVVDDPKNPAAAHIVRGTSVGALVMPRAPAAQGTSASAPAPTPRLAADVLHGRSVDEVARDIADAWTLTHAK